MAMSRSSNVDDEIWHGSRSDSTSVAKQDAIKGALFNPIMEPNAASHDIGLEKTQSELEYLRKTVFQMMHEIHSHREHIDSLYHIIQEQYEREAHTVASSMERFKEEMNIKLSAFEHYFDTHLNGNTMNSMLEVEQKIAELDIDRINRLHTAFEGNILSIRNTSADFSVPLRLPCGSKTYSLPMFILGQGFKVKVTRMTDHNGYPSRAHSHDSQLSANAIYSSIDELKPQNMMNYSYGSFKPGGDCDACSDVVDIRLTLAHHSKIGSRLDEYIQERIIADLEISLINPETGVLEKTRKDKGKLFSAVSRNWGWSHFCQWSDFASYADIHGNTHIRIVLNGSPQYEGVSEEMMNALSLDACGGGA